MDKHLGYIRIIIGFILMYLSKELADIPMIIGMSVTIWDVL